MKLEEESTPDSTFEYDDEDDVSIRSLFSSMESVNDDFEDTSSCSEDESPEVSSKSSHSQSNSSRTESKSSITQEFYEFKSNSLNNLQLVEQKVIKPTLKLPYISPTRNVVQNVKVVCANPQNPPVVNNKKTAQPVQEVQKAAPVVVQPTTNSNPQNRFIIAVPSLNPNQPLYEKKIVKKLAPVQVQVQVEKPKETNNTKIIHHHYFYNPQPIKLIKSKISIVSNKNNEKNLKIHEDGSKFLKFVKKNHLSSSDIDLNVSSRIFTFNEVTLKKI